MNFKQLFTVGNSNTPSASQVWFHIINTAVTVIYIYIGIKIGMLVRADVTNIPQVLDSFMLLTLVVSGLITGNKFANMIVNLKYGKKDDSDIKST